MVKSITFAVILPAAGRGARFGGGDKLLEKIGTSTVLQRAVGLFARRQDVSMIVLATEPDRFAAYQQHVAEMLNNKPLMLVEGGRQRWETVMNAVHQLPADVTHVAIHDAARPLTPAAVIDDAFAHASSSGASVPATPEPATLKRCEGGVVVATVSRRGLFQAQTPQCFERQRLAAAYRQLQQLTPLPEVTDDAQVMELAGFSVSVSKGSALNLKITTAEDLAVARALAALSGNPAAMEDWPADAGAP